MMRVVSQQLDGIKSELARRESDADFDAAEIKAVLDALGDTVGTLVRFVDDEERRGALEGLGREIRGLRGED